MARYDMIRDGVAYGMVRCGVGDFAHGTVGHMNPDVHPTFPHKIWDSVRNSHFRSVANQVSKSLGSSLF